MLHRSYEVEVALLEWTPGGSARNLGDVEQRVTAAALAKIPAGEREVLFARSAVGIGSRRP
ncbi:hypothetical protein [Streptomyces albidus (ex Kaewkla and Franco 2022)]|uniref:hypothetical protein n=1 Tax=Streptomyces albidus (ex Kaewkla and Franco 2022) TaxID=722709 RepID=UPI0015EEE507|nr:hypothetical protein [Streptomyces albidus (ex Kaewkla and Franco 2022)]